MIDWEGDLYYSRLTSNKVIVAITSMTSNKKVLKDYYEHYENFSALHKGYITNDLEEHKKNIALLKSWSTLL